MKRKFIVMSLIVVLFFVGLGYLFFNGNPITREKSKEIAAEYLEKNYPDQSFTIDSVGYYPGEGTYIVHFISKDEKLQGNIDVIDGIARYDSLEIPTEE